ncbi:MAG: hypothetical protein HWD58_07770 [Bacteroidota bacterium]|nr:MAG: hypothetical protein HWD58_07770 [Bacteroidota bacterium]
MNNTSTQAEDCTITVTGNNYSYSITLYQIIPTTSGNLDGNINSGKWATFTGLSAGSYTISISTTSVQSQPTTSTFSILTYLPYSDYFDKQNSSDNNNGNTILNLDLKTDFCAVGNGTANDALSCNNASSFINDRRGAVNLNIPSGTYLINIQDPNINFPANRILFDFIECTNLTITGATGSGGSPASIFKFADGQRYGCFDANPNQNPNPNPIVCSLSTYTANPGTLFNFTNVRILYFPILKVMVIMAICFWR